MYTHNFNIRLRWTAPACLLIACALCFFPSDSRAAFQSSDQTAVTADLGQASVERSSVVATPLFADYLRELIGSRRRMIQVSLVIVVIALFVIWWR